MNKFKLLRGESESTGAEIGEGEKAAGRREASVSCLSGFTGSALSEAAGQMALDRKT